MTISQYFKNGGKWIINCDTHVTDRFMTVNVGFLNNSKLEDETQISISAYNINELNTLFTDFCKENKFTSTAILYISVVQTAETMKELY